MGPKQHHQFWSQHPVKGGAVTQGTYVAFLRSLASEPRESWDQGPNPSVLCSNVQYTENNDGEFLGLVFQPLSNNHHFERIFLPTVKIKQCIKIKQMYNVESVSSYWKQLEWQMPQFAWDRPGLSLLSWYNDWVGAPFPSPSEIIIPLWMILYTDALPWSFPTAIVTV